MRVLLVWDGSGRAMAAFEEMLPLFRPAAFAHIEITMLVWPQRDTAMWADILEEQILSDDLHRAAAKVSADYAERLRAAVAPVAERVHVLIRDLEVVGAVKNGIVEFAADMVFFLIGSVAADSQIAIHLQEVLREVTVPVSVLHAPARVTSGGGAENAPG